MHLIQFSTAHLDNGHALAPVDLVRPNGVTIQVAHTFDLKDGVGQGNGMKAK